MSGKTTAITDIVERIVQLEAELVRARNALQYFQSLGNSTNGNNSGQNHSQAQKPKTMTEGLKMAMEDLNGITTVDIYAWLNKHLGREYNKKSVRSILSSGKKQGLFKRTPKGKWSLKLKKPTS